jgi:hypothetical protein
MEKRGICPHNEDQQQRGSERERLSLSLSLSPQTISAFLTYSAKAKRGERGKNDGRAEQRRRSVCYRERDLERERFIESNRERDS